MEFGQTKRMNVKNNGQKPSLWRIRSGERRVILVLGDLLVTVVALFVALYFWAQKDWLHFSWSFLLERPPFWFYLLPLIWVVLLIEIYDVRRASRRSDVLKGVGIAAVISLLLYLILYFSAQTPLPRRGVFAFIIVTALLTILWRLVYIRVFTAPLFMRRVLIIGAGRAGSTLAKVINQIHPNPFYLVGFIDDNVSKFNTKIDHCPVLGGCDQLLQIIQREGISDLVFSISGEMSPAMFQALQSAAEQGVEITTMPMIYEELLGRVPILLLQSDWLVRSFADEARTGGFYEIAKRFLDILGGLVGGILLLFSYPFIALAILLDTGHPILYSQIRLGKNGRIYKIVKYRTMRRDAEKDGIARPAIQNDERVTRVGYFLRKSHLDELPQFINVLRGDMSLVGPRAERCELVEELQNNVPFYRARLLAKPGLTGWAQINFGYAATVEDTTIKLEYDLYYIKHRNLFLDIVILVRTVGAVVGLRGQ
jgi:exopolysaccharide biosynthesis polyprenyl glycosylphosphotransferase